ncbi:MAG: SPOR domain-containing protein [Polyangia bacterium]
MASSEREHSPDGSGSAAVAASGGTPLPYAGERGEAAALDGRQIFFLFVGGAVCACLTFGLGVHVGRRVERKALAQAQAQAQADPLAALDELANAEEALTFHRALLDRPSPLGTRPRPAVPGAPAGAESDRPSRPVVGPPLSARPRYALQGPLSARRAEAEAQARKLREAGYRVSIQEVPGQVLSRYRVLVGDFATVEAAQPIQQDLLRKFRLESQIAPM